MTPTVWTLPAETHERVGPISMAVGGTPVTDFQIAVTPYGTSPPAPADEPDAWETPDQEDDGQYVWFGNGTPHLLTPGQWYAIAGSPNNVSPAAPVVEEIGIVKCP